MELQLLEYLNLFVGSLIIWVGIYLVSRNFSSKTFWTIMLYLLSVGTMMVTDTFLRNAPDIEEYILWQKMTDWAIFFMPALFTHASIRIAGNKHRSLKYVIYLGYIIAIAATALDASGNYILNREEIRFAEYRRFDGFEAGPLLVPAMGSLLMLSLIGNIQWWKKPKTLKINFLLPVIAGAILSLALAFGIASFYVRVQIADVVLGAVTAIGTLLFGYAVVKYHISSDGKILLNKSFYVRTIIIYIIISVYIIFLSAFLPESYDSLIVYCLIIVSLMMTHSFYDWFVTFSNDFIYNISSGLSVVADDEAAQLLRNYNSPQKLEDSPLLRLKIIKIKIRKGSLGIDALRSLLDESLAYFKPIHEQDRRIKSNLKYQILKMLAYDESEEGQMLWNLGFDEYPVRIMSQAGSRISPQFTINSPSDYSFTSRNAYLALKKKQSTTWPGASATLKNTSNR